MNKKKIKHYKVTPNESLCLAVSVVDKPAVETDFVYLSEQRQENFVAVEKPERRMIYGCALRSDFPIYRNNGKEEYYLEFDAQAIDKISKDFMKNGFQSNWTAGHKAEVEGLTVTEIWLKESPTIDKSIAVGLDPTIPVGSLFLGCYCENDEIWEAVKNHQYNGFSIEALVGLEEFEAQIKEPTLDEGTEINQEVEEAKVENVTMEEETPPTEPNPEHTEAVEEVRVEDTKEEQTETNPEPPEEPKPNPLEDLVKTLTEEIKALKESNEGLNKKIKELNKQPSAKPISTVGGKGNGGENTYQQWRSMMREMIG